MLSAIELDHQSGGVTDEIADIVFNWDLTAKRHAVKPVIPKFGPEPSFSDGGILPERACVRAQLG